MGRYGSNRNKGKREMYRKEDEMEEAKIKRTGKGRG